MINIYIRKAEHWDWYQSIAKLVMAEFHARPKYTAESWNTLKLAEGQGKVLQLW